MRLTGWENLIGQKPRSFKPVGMVLVILVIMVIISGCRDVFNSAPADQENYRVPLQLRGDVENPLELEYLDDFAEVRTIEYRDETLEVIALKDLIEDAVPHSVSYSGSHNTDSHNAEANNAESRNAEANNTESRNAEGYNAESSNSETRNNEDPDSESSNTEASYSEARNTANLNILFNSLDGFFAEIDGEELSGSYLTWSKESGWEAINLNHPVSSNIKDISDIVIVADDVSLQDSFNIVEPGENLLSLTPGQLFKDGYRRVPVLRGSSTNTFEDKELEATTYNWRRMVELTDYYDYLRRDEILVVGERGEVIPLRQDGRFVLQDNTIAYLQGREIEIEDVTGLVLDPPEKMITGVYDDIKNFLERGEKVLVIMIDGLGYHQYQYGREQGYVPFLSSLPEPVMAMSAYPPVTPVNLAASLTGELPPVNGITRRGPRQPEVPTIFADFQDSDKSAAAVIGPMGTIEFEISPIYSLDENQDGSTDDEKTENALAEIEEEDHDLLFVHYKDVDNAGHSYGDLAQETMDAINRNDDFAEKLVQEWSGKVIIYSDHGMHETEEGGDHHSLRTEDIFTPYWIFDGGDFNE